MNLDLLETKLIALAAAVIVLANVLVWIYLRKQIRKTAGMRQRFGPEYDQALLAHGSERKAEIKIGRT